tara:strand:+ start:228 stop:605 length:378 start_codon:yes stop_codon:yes gene_type:complete
MEILLSILGKHWKEITIACLLFAISFLWWQDHKGLVNAYDASVESYEVRIKELKESHVRETERKEQALQEYKDKLNQIELEYIEYQQAVSEATAERVSELINLRRENPEQLIQEIEEKFGFEYVE